MGMGKANESSSLLYHQSNGGDIFRFVRLKESHSALLGNQAPRRPYVFLLVIFCSARAGESTHTAG